MVDEMLKGKQEEEEEDYEQDEFNEDEEEEYLIDEEIKNQKKKSPDRIVRLKSLRSNHIFWPLDGVTLTKNQRTNTIRVTKSH